MVEAVHVVKTMDAKAAVNNGTALDCTNYSKITLQIIATSVSTGATVTLEASLDGTNYGSIGTKAVSANGSFFIAISCEAYKWVRPAITAGNYTDGTYTCYTMVSRN